MTNFGTVASSPKPNKFFSDISMYSQEPYSFEFLRTPHTVFSFKLIAPIPTNPSLQETHRQILYGKSQIYVVLLTERHY